MKKVGEHAIIIGGSIGGLLAARAASDFYERVTVLERDAYPARDEPRKGVPQGRHSHGLLAQGRQVLEDFFPGITGEVVAAGGICSDMANDVTWVGRGVSLKGKPSDITGLLSSRPVLEGCLRRRVLGLANVRLVENCPVLGLLADQATGTVHGVRVDESTGEATLAADLVVDATGRGSLTPSWLRCLGYEPAVEQCIEIGLGYLTRLYRRQSSDMAGKLAVVVAGDAPHWRTGAISIQNLSTWTVSIGGYFGDHPPRDNAGFLDYARSLSSPELHAAIATAEPVSDFAFYNFPANTRRRYEDLARFPKGYLVFGDAISSFNPVYGQGMTVAAQEAVLLGQCLREGTDDLARRFFSATKPVLDVPWNIAAGNDQRHPRIKDGAATAVKAFNWYIGKVYTAAERDGELTTTFLDVANLRRDPKLLLHPATILRVLGGNIRRRLSPAPVTNIPKAHHQGALLFLAIGLLAGLMAILAHQPGEWF